MKLSHRATLTLAAAVTLAAVLAACSPQAGKPAPTPAPTASGSDSGLSPEAADALLNAVPGLRDADVGSMISGLSTEVVVEVSVDDAAAIEAPGILDYVLRVGWATSVAQEPSQLSLTVWSGGARLDLQPEANLLAGVEYPAFPLLYSVHLNAPAYLGAWPGTVPAPPV